MKPNHFRVVYGKKPDRIKILSMTSQMELSAEQYHQIGNALLSLGKMLEPEKELRVELLTLDEDGDEPFFTYN